MGSSCLCMGRFDAPPAWLIGLSAPAFKDDDIPSFEDSGVVIPPAVTGLEVAGNLSWAAPHAGFQADLFNGFSVVKVAFTGAAVLFAARVFKVLDVVCGSWRRNGEGNRQGDGGGDASGHSSTTRSGVRLSCCRHVPPSGWTMIRTWP